MAKPHIPEPTFMVFRAPGLENIHGHLVEYKVVLDSEKDKFLGDGWHGSAIEAGEAHKAKLASEPNDDDTAAATREEAIQWLESQNIVFDRRLGTKKLIALVEEKRGG